MLSLELEDIMVQKVITLEADSSLGEAIALMNTHEIGCLIVTKDERPVGIITERDLLKRLLANIPELPQIKVQQIMSKPLKTGKPNMELEQAARLMVEQKIKKLPVTQGDKLVGLITLTDILRFQPQLIRIYKILSSDVVPPRIKKVFDYYTLLYPEKKGILKQNLQGMQASTGSY